MQLNDNVYTYDTMNRLDTMSFTFDGQTALFDYAYDLVGRQTQSALTLNNVADRAINIEYDYLGRALSAELTGNALNDILAELDYNSVGALTNVTRYEWDDNDDLYELIAKSNIQYNARNQITCIAHNNAAGNSIVSHGYLYNADGNISQYTNSLDGSVLYDYDFLGQLTGADYSNLSIHGELYLYDLNGNRELVTNANGDLVVYSTGTNNELNSDGNYSYAYDAEGNRISKTNAAGTERELYSWDYRNRLESVTKQEYNATTQEWEDVQIVEYAYDYNNVLIRKVLDADGDGTADSKTLFLPENYQTAIQLDDADLSDSTYETVSHRYLWTPGQQDKLLADIQVSPTDSETLWTLTDHLGTIRDVVKNTPSGLVVPAHIIYDAYGNVLSCKDANGTDVSNPVIFGFTGKYFDADTQLQNNVNRWYDSITGRWLSTDPIGFEGNDTNLYRYVGNRSVSYFDNLALASFPGGVSPYTVPVSKNGECFLAVHCWNVTRWGFPLGVHCGLTLDCNGKITRLDGSGGTTNKILINDFNTSMLEGPRKQMPSKVCKCLMDYVNFFNTKKIPRGHLEGNSNWVLSCMLSHCGITINWNAWSTPTRYGIPPKDKAGNCYSCP